MGRRLPPLNAVRAFEAAARHRSVKKAAEELFVTPGAVSQQVKLLEDWLGLPLFLRHPRGLTLTEEGSRLWPQLTELLDGLEKAACQLREDCGRTRVLTLSTIPSFAARWLVPRLGTLHERHPWLEVRVQVNPALTDFRREPIDLAIRHGAGVYPGLFVDFLLRDELFPVCSPRLVEKGPPLREPTDLRHHTLLHDETDSFAFREVGWAEWLAAAGVKGIDPNRGPRFTYTHMTIQAAIGGQGVALAPRSHVAEDLAAGLLVRPFALSIPDPYSFYVVCPTDRADRPDVAAFREWVKEQAAAL